MKTIILNDVSSSGHVGCKLTMLTYREQLDRVGIELVDTIDINEPLEPNYREFEKVDFLIVNGEGSIHDNNRLELIRIASLFPSVLINCVYQNNLDLPQLKDFRYIAARESLSAAEIPVNSEVVPDIVFASKLLNCFTGPQPCRKRGTIDSCIDRQLSDIKIFSDTIHFLTMLCWHEGIATGRFHGSVICAVLGIPFSVYPSNTHKNRGLMADIGAPELHFETKEEAFENIPKKVNTKVQYYTDTAISRIEHMFNKLEGLL